MSRTKGERAEWTLRDREFRVALAQAGFKTYAEAARAAGISPARLANLVGGLRCGFSRAQVIAAAVKKPVEKVFAGPKSTPAQAELILAPKDDTTAVAAKSAVAPKDDGEAAA